MANPLAALGSVGSLMSGASSLMNNKSQEQYRYQTMLNRQQQAYARENRQAELSNQYQYQFNLPLLNKKGMQAAGYSLAGIESGSVSSASTPGTASPSAGAAPTGAADVTAQLGVANLLQQTALVHAQTEKTKEEARGQRIQNNVDEASVDWDKSLRQSEAMIRRVDALNAEKYGERKASAEVLLTEIETWIKDNEYYLGGALTEANLDIAKQTLLNLKETCTLLKKQGFQVDKQMSLIDANIRSLDAGTAKTKAETTGISLDNRSKAIDVDAKEENKSLYKGNFTRQLKLAARDIDLKNDVIDNEKLMLELEQKFGRDTRDRLRRLSNSDNWYDSLSGNVLLWLMDNLNIAGSFLPDFK